MLRTDNTRTYEREYARLWRARGLICGRCNSNLEWFIDNEAAVEVYRMMHALSVTSNEKPTESSAKPQGTTPTIGTETLES